MSHIRLRCTRCGASHAADMVTLECRKCGAPLEVDYAEAGLSTTGVQPLGWTGPTVPMPLHDPGAGVSLGEGGTPCVELSAIGKHLGLRTLYAKLEFLNPTGSFKDRGSAVMMGVAREHGVEELVEDSSGNAGASVSAYAARAGVKAHIFVPASAPQAKLGQIRAYGAEVHSVEGSREDTTAAAMAYVARRRLVYASHALSPYYFEGTKTFAYEVAERFAEEGLPRHILFPVGNGSLLIGTWIGLRELREAGQIAEVPRLHCVQGRAVMPIVAAHHGEAWSPGDATNTVAGGIAVAAPPRREQVLAVLRATNGDAVAVEESDILRFQRLLAETEGIFAELTSAAAFAGLEKLVKGGVIEPDEPVLVPVTGSGLKDVPPPP